MVDRVAAKDLIDGCFRHSLVRISDIRVLEGGEQEGRPIRLCGGGCRRCSGLSVRCTAVA